MPDRRLKVPLLLSLAAALLALGLKGAAYALTGSVALLSDALESVVNLLAALAAYFSLWYAARPADLSHTYGHEKIEFFSSGLEGTLILFAACGIGWVAGDRLLDPPHLQRLEIGGALALAASVINLLVARILIRVGRAHRSVILEADGQHLMTDVWATSAVLSGLVVVAATGLRILDPLIGLAAAGHVGWTAIGLLRRSVNGLMDHALPAEEQSLLRQTIRAAVPADCDFHALRSRRAGTRRFADFHLLVPGETSVRDAHRLAERVEQALRLALPGLEVGIHVEPIEEAASWHDSELLAQERAARARGE